MKVGDLVRCRRVDDRWGTGLAIVIEVFRGDTGSAAKCCVGVGTVWVNFDELETVNEEG